MSFPKNFALLQIIEMQKSTITLNFNRHSPANSLSPVHLQTPLHNVKRKSSINPFQKIKEELRNINNSSSSPVFNRNSFRQSTVHDDKICQVHKKKMDLFCLEDRERICTNCALFGNHKNHEIEEEEEVLKRINAKAEKLLEILEKIEGFDEKQINSLSEIGKLFENCLIKRGNITSFIQDKFSVILQELLNNL